MRPGMSQEQVRAVLGTPLMTDDFHKNRWDYVFYIKEGTQISRQRGVTVFLMSRAGFATSTSTNKTARLPHRPAYNQRTR
ncbi:MAG: outer membrane protein assembly factor BamE [Thiolinea sp.]